MAKLVVKESVRFKDFSIDMIAMLNNILMVAEASDKDVTITSANDSTHLGTSLHYKGLALDIRTKDRTPKEVDRLFKSLRQVFNDDYDVILEKDHIHLELDR